MTDFSATTNHINTRCFIFTIHFTGYGYPSISDSRNLGDDGEDEVLTSQTYDQSNWQASNNQPAGPVYTSYDIPAATPEPDWTPSHQNLLHAPSGPAAERLINGVSRDWGLEKLDKPITFPLPSAPAKPQPGPVQPQSTSVGVPATHSEPAAPSTGSSAHFASPAAYHVPSSTFQAAKSPSLESWQPEPVASGYGEVNFNTDFSAASGYLPHLVYEDVFQYPPQNNVPFQNYKVSNTAGSNDQANHMSQGSSAGYASSPEEPSSPSYPSNPGSQPIYQSDIGSFHGGMNLGETVYQPHDELSWGPQKPAYTQTVEVSQRVSEPISPPAQSPVYSFRSRSAYQHGKQLFTQTRYTPEFPIQTPVSSESVDRPAPSQPAAPKGANNPQRYVHHLKLQPLNSCLNKCQSQK